MVDSSMIIAPSIPHFINPQGQHHDMAGPWEHLAEPPGLSRWPGGVSSPVSCLTLSVGGWGPLTRAPPELAVPRGLKEGAEDAMSQDSGAKAQSSPTHKGCANQRTEKQRKTVGTLDLPLPNPRLWMEGTDAQEAASKPKRPLIQSKRVPEAKASLDPGMEVNNPGRGEARGTPRGAAPQARRRHLLLRRKSSRAEPVGSSHEQPRSGQAKEKGQPALVGVLPPRGPPLQP